MAVSKQYKDPYDITQLSGIDDSLAFSNTPTYTAPKITRTEQVALEQRTQEAAIQSEISTFQDQLANNPEWNNASITGRRDMLTHWEDNLWPAYAKQRFGSDTTAANAFKNAIVQPIRIGLDRLDRETNTWGNTLYSTWQSIARGADSVVDTATAIPLAIDAQSDAIYRAQLEKASRDYDDIYGSRSWFPDEASYNAALQEADDKMLAAKTKVDNNAVAFTNSLNRLVDAQAASAQNEVERRIANPQRMDDYRREEEILQADPKAVAVWERFLESGPRPLVNALLEQWANMGFIIGSTSVGSTVGTAVGGPLGTVVGGAAGAAISGAIVTAGGVVNDIMQEVYSAPIKQLRQLPNFKALIAKGMTEDQARVRIARDASNAAYPFALGLGAVSGVVGPEALLAKSSVLAPFIKGGFFRRVLSSGALSGLEEYISEGSEALGRNTAWNTATGDSRDITQGAQQQALTGALIGSVVGGAASVIHGHPDSDTTGTGGAKEEPSVSNTDDENSNTQGTFSVPQQTETEAVPTDLTNPNYNTETVAQTEQATQVAKRISTQIDELQSRTTPITEKDVLPLFQDLYEFEQLSNNPELIENTLANLQVTANIPVESDLNIPQRYTAWSATQREAVASEHTSTTTGKPDSQVATNPVSEAIEPTVVADKTVGSIDFKESQAKFRLDMNKEKGRGIFTQVTDGETVVQRAETNAHEQAVFEGLANIVAKQMEDAGRDASYIARNAEGLTEIIGNLAVTEGLTIAEAAQRVGIKTTPEAIVEASRNPQPIGRADEQLRQTTQGRAGAADTDSVASDSTTTANQQRGDATVISSSPESLVGDSTAAESTGLSRATQQDSRTAATDANYNQQNGRETRVGADSGRGSSIADPNSTRSDTGERGVVGETEQRTSDGRRTEDAGRSAETGLTVEQQTTLDNTINNIVDDMTRAGIDPTQAREFVTSWEQGMRDLLESTPTEVIETTDTHINEESTNYVADTIEKAEANPNDIGIQAVDEAMQSSADMVSPLALFGNMDDATIQEFTAGVHTPEIYNAIYGNQNGVLADTTSTTVKGSEEANPVPQTRSAEEVAVEVESLTNSINDTLAEGNVPNIGSDIINTDGSTTVSENVTLPAEQEKIVRSCATIIADIANNLSEAVQLGIQMAAHRRQAFHDTAYSPRWVAGNWAKFATTMRRTFADAGADFRTWALEHFSAANANPDQTPLIQAFETMGNSISGSMRVLTDNIITPIVDWAETQARRYNVDVDQFLEDIGQFQTVMHTLEAAPYQRMQLEKAVQEAYMLPAGQEKLDAIKSAEESLQRYNDRQNGVEQDNPAPIYGGRTVAECQEIIAQQRAKYDEQTLAEGTQMLRDGFNYATRYLAENGQITQETIDAFPQWMYYSALTTDKETGTGAANDVSIYMPRTNFHRYGSVTPAHSAWRSLSGYASRAARSVGMADFGTFMREAYLVLEQRGGNRKEANGVTFHEGIAMVDAGTISSILSGDGGKIDVAAYKWAQSIKDNTAAVIRVMEKNNNGDNVVHTYHVLFDQETHAREQQALKSPFDNADPKTFASKLAKTTSSYARIYTGLRPLFPVVNGGRDTIERISILPSKIFTNEQGQSVSGAKIASQMASFLANPVNLYRLVRYHTTGSSGSSYIDGHLNDFFSSGTSLSGNYNSMLRNYNKQITADVQSNLPKSITKLGPKAVKQVTNVISKWGEFFYSLPTFAQYIKMRENDISVRNTVAGVNTLMNAQQRGTLTGKYLAPLFPFTNSIGQTAVNLVGALGFHTTAFSSHPNAKLLRKNAIKGWATMMVGYAGVRALIPMIASSLGSEEEGQRRLDLIPLGQLSTFLPIGTGEGTYFKMPTGFGIMQLAAMAAYGADRVERGKMSPGELGATMLTTFGKTLIPNSAPSFAFSQDPFAYIMQTFSPMLVQPFVQIGTNRSYSGQRITHDTYDDTTRRSDKYNLTTHQNWIAGVKAIYDTTGIDMTPEQLRTLAGGYLGGVLQGVVSWIEQDPLYKNPDYQSTREVLGPFWTAMGATSLYNVGMNVPQSSMYNAMGYYENKIKEAGIGNAMTGAPKGISAEDYKRQTMAAAGFTIQEIDDYIALYKADSKLSKLNGDVRKQLDLLYGPDMDEDTIRSVYSKWSSDRLAVQTEVVNSLNFYNRDYRGRFDNPDAEATAMIRREIPNAPVEIGNIDLYKRPVVHNTDGTISTVKSISFQDENGLQVLIPTIGPNGERWSNEQAIRYYYQTGQHLGKFRTIDAANAAAEQIHEEQDNLYSQ